MRWEALGLGGCIVIVNTRDDLKSRDFYISNYLWIRPEMSSKVSSLPKTFGLPPFEDGFVAEP